MRHLVHVSSRFRCPTTARAPFTSRRGYDRTSQIVWRRVLLVGTLALAACGRSTITDGVSDSVFVATMAELERIDRALGMDSVARAAARAKALQRQGLSRAQLESAATALGDDPKRALALWRAIDAKVSTDSTAQPAPSGMTPPNAVTAKPAASEPPAPAPTSTGSPAIRRR